MIFSIVTCTWNSAKHLPACIASVQAQQGVEIEWIFVDGGSDDGTLDLIRAIPRPVILLENVRGGVSRAMNAGLAVATGDVVAYMHSDDYYRHPEVLAAVATAWKAAPCDWLVGRILVDQDGKLRPSGAAHRPYSRAALASGQFFVPHPATFVSRGVLQGLGGFDESLRYAMDWDLWLRLARRHSPAVLNEDVAVFREHAGSLTGAGAKARLAAMREEWQVRLRHLALSPWHTAVWMGRYLLRTRRLRRRARAEALG